MRDENGLEKCVACGLCAVACPADAIYLEAAENDGSVQAGPRYAKRLPDPQDALHLLRLLRRGLPGVGDLHGQGLRARGLQQQGLHLGQDRPAGAGARDDQRRRRLGPRHPFRLRGPRRHPRRVRRRAHDHRAPSRVPVLAVRRRHRRRAGRYESLGAPRLLDPRQQRQLRRDRGRRSAGRISITSPTATRRDRDRLGGGRADGRRPRRHVRADVVRDAGGGPAASEEGQREGHRAGRQAPALRPRRSRGLQAAARRRRPADPRSAEAVPAVSRRARTRRRQGADQRGAGGDAAAPAPVRPPPSLRRRSPSRACARSASIWSTRSYLLIDAATLAISSSSVR